MAGIASRILAALVVGVLVTPMTAAAQEAYEAKDLTEAPSIKSVAQAQRVITRTYPPALQQAGIEGTVQVRFIVGASGSVEEGSVEIIATSSQALAHAAITAVEGIDFVPGKKDGANVAAYVMMPIRYQAR